MIDLINHLLAERHRIPNQVIIDCLVLAQLNPSPDQLVSIDSLLLIMGLSHQASLSTRMCKLKRYGLIDYKAGVPRRPGYRILRVGPS